MLFMSCAEAANKMLYIVLPVHNRAEITKRFCLSLASQEFEEYRLLAIDDGCTDRTIEFINEIIGEARVTIIRGEGDLWWAGSLMKAYEYLIPRLLDEDSVLILNDDVTFGPSFLVNGLTALRDAPGAAIQALGKNSVDLEYIDRGVIANVNWLSFRSAKVTEEPNCLSTRGLIMSAKTFIQSDGFVPERLPHYLSDYEFTLRLHRKGVALKVNEIGRAHV